MPLRDGTWIPQIPAEVHRRGRTFGWITVTLEGPIYLLRTGLMAADDPMAVPILQDYEDNLYLSDRYGYSWEKHRDQWFSRGGISMQPNLLCSPHPYLFRDEIKHYLRAYFNAFASCYYPDTQMMCEHPLPDLGDWRGDHYKSSDEVELDLLAAPHVHRGRSRRRRAPARHGLAARLAGGWRVAVHRTRRHAFRPDEPALPSPWPTAARSPRSSPPPRGGRPSRSWFASGIRARNRSSGSS